MTPPDRTEFGDITDVLDAQIGAAIVDISAANLRADGDPQFCRAHAPMSAGLVVLLRCQRWQLAQEKKRLRVAGVTAAIVAAAIGILPSVLPVVWHWLNAPAN